jgi:hypothetical protein
MASRFAGFMTHGAHHCRVLGVAVLLGAAIAAHAATGTLASGSGSGAAPASPPAAVSAAANAGTEAAHGAVAPASAAFTPDQRAGFAKQVESTLAHMGARVAILARVGRPPSEMPEGMHYTHVAFAVYSMITTADRQQEPGYAIYNLYQKAGQPDRSELVQDFPVNFFSEVASLEAGILVPPPELQRRLLAVITSPTYRALHEPRYSLIANPYNADFQNCTEFVLDVIQAAIYQTDHLPTIKANTRAYFKAQPVKVSPLRLMLGSVFMREVSLRDHDGAPQTATFERIADYLRDIDPATQVFTLRSP